MGSAIIESETLLNAQLSFLNTRLALIHIPLGLYQLFLQPILSLLLHNDTSSEDGSPNAPDRPWMYWHPFVNVSITSNECSIACPRSQAESLFEPLLEKLPALLRKAVSISKEDYSVIVIGGEGLEAGKRVLDLTSPLALAGIPIFFITSYYSDYILVPFSARSTVISALEDRGFVLEADENGDAGHMTNPASPLLPSSRPRGSSNSSFDFSPIAGTPIAGTPIAGTPIAGTPIAGTPIAGTPIAGTPPAATVPELQTKTFKLLSRHGITPIADPSISLVTCASVKDSTASTSASNFSQGKLQLGLTKCLVADPPCRFLSVTLTDTESASLTLETRLTANFCNDGEDLLLGKDGPEQVAITLDLTDLPFESTGIVCGVASRLSDGMRGRVSGEVFNMSYLSTARAGHVIVYADELEDVMGAFQGVAVNGNGVGH